MFMGTGKIRLNLIRGHLLKLRLKSEFGHRRGLKLTYEGSLGYSCILLIYTTKVAIARYFSIGDKFLNAKISKIILVVMFSTNTYNISIAPPFSFLKWYSNKKSIKN